MAATSSRLRVGLLAASAVLLLTRLGATGLWAPDEPRYAQIADELRSGRHGATGVLLLHLNDEPYTQKPPLYYWMAAAFGMPWDRVTETTARLPSALSGIALVMLTLAFGARLLGGRSGILGAAFLLTTFQFARHARRMQLDVMLALFEALALVAFWRLDRGLGRRRANQALLHGAMGLALLTKGPVGFVVPVLGMVSYALWEGRWRELRRAFPAWGLLLSLGPVILWMAASVALAPGGYFDEAVIDNVFGRFFRGTDHVRPFYYYLYTFPVRFMPWALLLPVVVWTGRRFVFAPGASGEERRAWRFLIAWVGATLLFFTLSSGKRGIYLLPCYPAAALLCADALRRWIEDSRRIPTVFHLGVAAVGAAVLGAGVWVGSADVLDDPPLSMAVGVAALVLVLGVGLALAALARVRAPLGLRIAVIVGGVFLVDLAVLTVVFPAIDAQKSPRAVAEAAAALTPESIPVGLFGDRALTGGLVYYGRRGVANLENAGDVERFLADGGRAIVIKARRLGLLEAVTPVQVRFRAREDSRELLVVTPHRVQ